MTNRFDITLDRKLDRKLDGKLAKATDAAVEVRRIEVITGTGRRRRWSGDDKARILCESLQPGVNVSEVARRHGLSPQQLFAWRNAARADIAGIAEAQASSEVRAKARERSIESAVPAFTPVIVATPAALPAPQASPGLLSAPNASTTPGTIEITLGDATVRVSGQVETQLIAAVMRAVRRAS